jgi:Trk-type K+ transport system membrane component
MTIGTAGALALALFGGEIIEAVSLAVSAVSTTGPGISEAGTITTAAELSRVQRLVLMPLMLAGRVFLYPAFVLIGVGFFGTGRFVASRRPALMRKIGGKRF